MSHVRGQWNVICDVCGFEFKSSEIKKRWDGLLVCHADFELDHPQKYIKVQPDGLPVPSDMIRAEPEDTFIGVCTVYTNQGVAGAGVAGCMIAGKVSSLRFDSYGNPI
jgi:hypothetical protein